MTKEKLTLRSGIITLIVLSAALSRLIPHPANFAPTGAMALFGAACYPKRYLVFLIPVLTMRISDLILNNILYNAYFDYFVWFYSGSVFTCGAFALIVVPELFSLERSGCPILYSRPFGHPLSFISYPIFAHGVRRKWIRIHLTGLPRVIWPESRSFTTPCGAAFSIPASCSGSLSYA